MKIKRIVIFLLLTSVIFTLSACSTKDKPQAVVREFFDCLETGKWNTADTLCDESIFSKTFFSNTRNVSRLLIDNSTLKPEIMKNTRLEAAAQSEIKGDTATVKIRVSAYNLPEVLSDYMMLVVASGENQLDIEKIVPAMLAATPTVETELTVTLIKQEDESWLIHSTDELADAITGGLSTATTDNATDDATDESTDTQSQDKGKEEA